MCTVWAFKLWGWRWHRGKPFPADSLYKFESKSVRRVNLRTRSAVGAAAAETVGDGGSEGTCEILGAWLLQFASKVLLWVITQRRLNALCGRERERKKITRPLSSVRKGKGANGIHYRVKCLGSGCHGDLLASDPMIFFLLSLFLLQCCAWRLLKFGMLAGKYFSICLLSDSPHSVCIESVCVKSEGNTL